MCMFIHYTTEALQPSRLSISYTTETYKSHRTQIVRVVPRLDNKVDGITEPTYPSKPYIDYLRDP